MSDLYNKIVGRMAAKRGPQPQMPMPETPKKGGIGRTLKFLFLPDLGKRFRDIGQRLGGFAYFLAQIFYSCRLLPAGHPTLQAANIGYFGFIDVISAAAANLQLRKENADQIIMFVAVILSMVLLLANGIAIGLYTLLDFGSALADDGSGVAGTAAQATGSMFAAPHADTDLGLTFLFRVFGTDIFDTGSALNINAGTNPMQAAIYKMLGLYSTAMMIIAVIIVLYYAMTIVGESAMTGQPFGKRFNSFWAPIRLVVGLGLLVPIAGGLNAAQYSTLYIAKLGSGFASYTWEKFITEVSNPEDLVAAPSPERITRLVYDVLQREICAATNAKFAEKDYMVGAVIRHTPHQGPSAGIVGTFNNAFGPGGRNTPNADTWSEYRWGPNGECGAIAIQNVQHIQNTSNPSSLAPDYDFSKLREAYEVIIQDTIEHLQDPVAEAVNQSSAFNSNPDDTALGALDDSGLAAAMSAALSGAHTKVQTVYAEVFEDFKTKMPAKTDEFAKFGWLGAGMYFNQIADLNSIFIDGTTGSFPKPTAGNAAAMSVGGSESAAAITATINDIMSGAQNAEYTHYSTAGAGGARARLSWEIQLVLTLMQMGSVEDMIRTKLGGAYFEQAFQSAPTNPMAMISGLGADLMKKSGEMFSNAIGAKFMQASSSVAAEYGGGIGSRIAGGAVGASAGAAMGNAHNSTLGTIVGAVGGAVGGVLAGKSGLALSATYHGMLAGFYVMFGVMGMLFGFFLFYVIPILPFVFFFFAVLTWILEIIEAMVGVPLWALAHIRTDGDGLPGQAAINGYHLLFGILLRPFLILFAFLFCIIMFSAAVSLLHMMMWNVLDSQAEGINLVIDYIVTSALYVLLVFIIMLLCAKQCDQLPNQVLRWFGSGAAAYQDGQQDPTSTIEKGTFALGYAVNGVAGKLGA